MSKLAIVTDSTASIPDDFIKNLPISIIPLHVIWGEEMYQDNVDIHQEEFYKRLPLSKILPSTSQPSPKEFIEMYKSIGQEYDEILSVHISSKLSGTVDSALQAKNYLSSMHIEVVDSLSTSMGLGFLTLIAAREAQGGKNLAECKRLVESARKRLHIYFVLHTLEFLKRGGRIGGASALLGTALNLKPVLMLDDGKIEPYEKVRTMRKALLRLTEILREKSEGKIPIHLALIHASAEQDAEFLLAEIKKQFKNQEIAELIIAGISPVLGTHAGPGAIGICFLTDK
jgi:DegV family protein with EDD domain